MKFLIIFWISEFIFFNFWIFWSLFLGVSLKRGGFVVVHASQDITVLAFKSDFECLWGLWGYWGSPGRRPRRPGPSHRVLHAPGPVRCMASYRLDKLKTLKRWHQQMNSSSYERWIAKLKNRWEDQINNED